MNAVDTNVLLYVQDPRDPVKQAVAAALVRSMADGVLMWQVACEFLAASKKLASTGFTRDQARQYIRDLRNLWQSVLPNWAVLDRAEQLQQQFSLSDWDSILIAACLEGSVAKLYSEDFSAYPRIQALEIVNPFAKPSP